MFDDIQKDFKHEMTKNMVMFHSLAQSHANSIIILRQSPKEDRQKMVDEMIASCSAFLSFYIEGEKQSVINMHKSMGSLGSLMGADSIQVEYVEKIFKNYMDTVKKDLNDELIKINAEEENVDAV